MKYLKDKFLNKEVRIFPNDTYYKYGIVRDISDKGVTFEITRTNATILDVGILWFVEWTKLTFTEVTK